jgi:subtilisin family serine protease
MALAIGNSRKNCRLDSLGILEAVRYAIDNGAKIINLSLGGPIGAPIAEATYRLASDKGVLLVIAAGNDGLSNDIKDIPSHSQFNLAFISRQNKVIHYAIAPQYPAAFSQTIDGILTVANLAKTDNANVLLKQRKYQYDSIGYNARMVNGRLKIDRRVQLNQEKWYVGSNYGIESVHIGSPGTDIYSTIPKKGRGHVVSAYKLMTGTSMASPITAGAAALVWSAFPNMNNIEIKERLLASVNKNPDLNGNLSSEGELDLFKALCGEKFSQRAAGCPSPGGTENGRKPREKVSPGRPKETTKPKTPEEKKNKPQYSNRDDEMNSWLTDDNSGSEQNAPPSGGIQW